jgi:UbiD family decarboxylase
MSASLNFQDHLAVLRSKGLLVEIDREINKDTQLHPLARLQFVSSSIAEDERRAFLFTNVTDSAGRRYDIPVVVGAMAASPRIYSIGMDKPLEEIGPAWVKAVQDPLPPVVIKGPAPCQEVVFTGDALKESGGISRLPVPVSTPGFDSAPFLTATVVTTRDPDTLVQNIGTYRINLKAPDRVTVRMWVLGSGGHTHALKYRSRKSPMPCAIVLGAAPVVMFAAAQKLPIGVDEVAVAGRLAGASIAMVKCVTQDLLVPADAEIVIEGYIDTEKAEPEGPFGESHGYVSLEMYNRPMYITAITQKRSPIMPSTISQVTPSESGVVKKIAYEPLFLAHLRDELALKCVQRVVMHEPLSNLRPVNFLQLKRGTPAPDVWRALRGAANWRPECGKIVIAVSEDIDPSSTDAVFWSLAYRCDPMKDVQLEGHRPIGHVPKASDQASDSTMMIDATLKGSLPPISLPARQYMEEAQKIWEELDMPRLSLRSPWHGYSLGDWSATWERYAARAVAGEWALTGQETLQQQRGDVEFETLIARE